MKYILASVIFLTFTLSGCNLPSGQATSPTPDFVSTQIATLLTISPVVPSVETPTPEVTSPAVESPTEEPSPTSLPTATVNPSPEDPRVQLGNPSFTDTLETGKSFGLESQAYDDDYTYIRVENGSMILTSRYATGFRGWRTGGTRLGDSYIEAPFHVSDCSGNDNFGLVFRSPDFVKGYWFQVTCSGNWELGYWDGNAYTSLKSGTNSTDAMRTGSNQTNRLGVWVTGSQIKLYINGKLVGQVEDSSQIDPGSFGATIASYNTPNLTITIDEFSYWKLD